jgi:hypothetical protein
MAMSKSHSQSHQSVLLGEQEGGDEEEAKPSEVNSSRPHHPHVVLPVPQEETKPSSHEAMFTPLGTSPPTVAPAPAAAAACAVSMDLVADAKKGDPKIIRRADSHSVEIRDVEMGSHQEDGNDKNPIQVVFNESR